MHSHSIRNSIVTGSFTLPVMAVVCLLVWMLPDLESGMRWGGLALTLVTTYLIMELNNRNTLLRVRSRMMSATFLLLMSLFPALHDASWGMVVVTCFIGSYFALFGAYQLRRPAGYVFHAFLLGGIGSLVFPPLWVCAVGYYVSLLFQLRAMTWRSLVAGLMGFALPYWFYAAYAIWQNRLDIAYEEWTERLVVAAPDFSAVTIPQWVGMGSILFFALLSFVHFFHTAYNDKIRTRMFFYAIATQEVILVAGMICLLPADYTMMLRLLIANTSLLMAHYYALGRGRGFDGWFYVSILLLLSLGVYNHLIAAGLTDALSPYML